MMGSFLSRALILVFGYAYPAYECYKTVELNKPEIEQLRFWCQYWILVAILALLEKFGDIFFSWLPMYCEAKLAFYIFLWYPKLRGTTYVYHTFVRPYIAKNETDIDRSLLELKTRVADIMLMYWQKASSYSRASVFEMLRNVILWLQAPRASPSQQTEQPQKPQQEQQAPSPVPPTHQPGTTQEPPQEKKMSSSAVKRRLQEQSRNIAFNLRSSSPVQPNQLSSLVSTPRQQEKKLPQSPIKNQLQEKSQKTDIHVRESNGSDAPREEPTQVELNLQDVEDSNSPPEDASSKLPRATSSRLRKRTGNAAS
ncbi:HVA22-like protein g [Canna indica]|uniref:HVA22-like protein n=1 Tax=Canna indica TaxID=4628 RepID=A0AAQ3KB78_9LILI|nr:HVA22-like protein g [Canna indica]